MSDEAIAAWLVGAFVFGMVVGVFSSLLAMKPHDRPAGRLDFEFSNVKPMTNCQAAALASQIASDVKASDLGRPKWGDAAMATALMRIKANAG